jgi:hypothetical protein
MKIVFTLAICATALASDQPVLRSWVMAQPANEAVRDIATGVHDVKIVGDSVVVQTAGLSLQSFGMLEANQYDVPSGPRILTFRIPLHPRKADVPRLTPLGRIGLFATGVPIYNPAGSVSWRDQGLWHQDAVAASQNEPTPLLSALINNNTRHSPIIGFGLDGFPIYGPYTDRRMRSSYRLRSITKRDRLPDGTLLTPGQEGPPVSAAFPLGTFAEDYEYVPGLGDLDESNGAFVKTPEYPQGTYAYFLSTDAGGRPTWPYLIGFRFFGEPATEVVPEISVLQFEAGEPARFRLRLTDSRGREVRFLEKVHEQPIHLVIVSKDLSEFMHIHPETAVPGDFVFSTRFAHGGDYLAFADYTAPGDAPKIARFCLHVAGPPAPGFELHPDNSVQTVGDVQVRLVADKPWQINTDVPFGFVLSNARTEAPLTDLEPWLGAWGHIMAISADGSDFIHAHPLEDPAPNSDPWTHSHATPIAGLSPSSIRTVTGFRKPGIYKVWVQFQRHGEVQTASFVVNVAAADAPKLKTRTPVTAIPITVTSAGFEPGRITVPAHQPVTLAFTRTEASTCVREVVFPELGIRKDLPLNGTVVLTIPAQPARELSFACGMGMYRGAVLVR